MEEKKLVFKKKMETWATKHYKRYYWRENRTDYTVFISEIFLQRTSVRQVSKIFEDFIQKVPNFQSLNFQNDTYIENLIKPLGLVNRRLKVLNKASEIIITNFNGNLPQSYDSLIKIYGIGRYIANAILSFLFLKDTPIVDTKIIRIFQRYFDLKSSKKYVENDENFWSLAEDLIPQKNPDIFNYGLIDFAHEICISKKPKCNICPVNKKCSYYKK